LTRRQQPFRPDAQGPLSRAVRGSEPRPTGTRSSVIGV